MRKLGIRLTVAHLAFLIGVAAYARLSASDSCPIGGQRVKRREEARKIVRVMVSGEEAKIIATVEAINDKVPFHHYRVVALEGTNEWRVQFLLKDPCLSGGGPEYTIDKESGNIVGVTLLQ